MINRHTCVLFFSVFVMAFVIAGCRGCETLPVNRHDKMTHDVATRGIIYVAADESYRFILEEEKFMFEHYYPHAEIHILYSDEKTAFENAMNDSVRLVVASTIHHNALDRWMHERNIVKRVVGVGRDAVVAAVHPECPLQQITEPVILDIVNGKINKWNQIHPSLPEKHIRVFFDSKRSGIARYFFEEGTQHSNKLTGKAADSTEQLLQWITEDENSIGFFPFNLISDKDDPRSRAIQKQVKILPVADSRNTSEYFLPSQTTIADSTYPFIRRMLIINKEGKTGLGTGFASFIAGPKGQKILLKAGLVPQRIPERNVEIVVK